MSSLGPVVRAEVNGFVLRTAEENVVVLTVIKLHSTAQDNRDEPVGSSRFLFGLGLGGNGAASRERKPLAGAGRRVFYQNKKCDLSSSQGVESLFNLLQVQCTCFLDSTLSNRLGYKTASFLLNTAIAIFL